MSPHERRMRGRKGIGAGIVLILIGLVWLLNRMHLNIPHWVFSWQMLLIIIGFIIGINTAFRNAASWILMFVGGFFLIDRFIYFVHVGYYFWPIALIVLGVIVLLRPRKSHSYDCGERWRHRKFGESMEQEGTEEGSDQKKSTGAGPHSIDLVAIFNGLKKNIYSKSFKGGESVTVFGGVELNLLQADFEGTITIDAVVVFGGMKLIVPPNWDVQVNNTTILGGVEDKRFSSVKVIPDEKTLVITGVVLFGGIDIVSY